MFRKPKKKVTTRQPIGGSWDDTENDAQLVEKEKTILSKSIEDDEEESPSFGQPINSKPPALLSFDHDEGADADFTVKKNKKQVDELKRQIKLEDELHKQQEEMKKIAIKVENIKKEDISEAEQKKLDKKKYLSKYGVSNHEIISDESDIEVNHSDPHAKFSTAFEGIPDSKAVFEAKKKRERMRREGDGYIPLEESNKDKREKNVRERLVREEDHDDSDEDTGRFYSSKQLAREEEERRRDEQNDFLEREQGDDDRDPEDDEWENQQIQKAVSRQAIGRIRPEFDVGSQNLQKGLYDYRQYQQQQEVDMDIDVDYEYETSRYSSSNGMGLPTSGGVINIEDVLAKLKLRIGDREESLKTKKYDLDRMEKSIEEKKFVIRQIELDSPDMANRYAMYQELKTFTRNLLDCLNEKVADINNIMDRRRHCIKTRTERLMRRRRRDVQDQYAECSALASAKPLQSVKNGDAAIRAAEREARRGRRRRERESTLVGISHEEGLSSDDEEPTSVEMKDKSVIEESIVALDTVFVDTLEEFSNLKKILDRIVDWLAVDGKSFEDAYVHLCIPKLCSPFVRMQLTKQDLLTNPDFTYVTTQWYMDCLLAGTNNTEVKQDHPIIVDIIPKVFEKVVVPYITDIVNDEWDPLSVKQSTNLNHILKGLSIYPTITAKSKPFLVLMESIKKKVVSCIDEDLFAPMFAKQAIENPNTGCRSFLDRQYWCSIKLIRCINALKDILAPEARFELIVENVINKACVLGIQFGLTNDVSCERKVKALIAEVFPQYMGLGGEHSFRSLSMCLTKVMNDQKEAGRDYHREIQKVLNNLNSSKT